MSSLASCLGGSSEQLICSLYSCSGGGLVFGQEASVRWHALWCVQLRIVSLSCGGVGL